MIKDQYVSKELLARFNATEAIESEASIVAKLTQRRAMIKDIAGDRLLPNIGDETLIGVADNILIHEIKVPHPSLDKATIVAHLTVARTGESIRGGALQRLKLGLFQHADRTQYFDFKDLDVDSPNSANIRAQDNYKPWDHIPQIDTIEYDAHPVHPKFSVRYLFGFNHGTVFATTRIRQHDGQQPSSMQPILFVGTGLILPGQTPERGDGIFYNRNAANINGMKGESAVLHNPITPNLSYDVRMRNDGSGYVLSVQESIGAERPYFPQEVRFHNFTNNAGLPIAAADNALTLLNLAVA